MADKAKPVTKSQLVGELAEKLGITKKDVGGFIDILSQIACRETKKNGAFTLPGIGKLVLVKRRPVREEIPPPVKKLRSRLKPS